MKRIVVGSHGSFAASCDFMDIKDDLVTYGIEITRTTRNPKRIITPYAEIEVLNVSNKNELRCRRSFDRCFGAARYWKHVLQRDDVDERDDYLGNEVEDVVGYVLYLKEKEKKNVKN